MTHRVALIPMLLAGSIIAAQAQLPPELKARFDEAERRIVRLPPKSFPQLPGNIVRELERRGCTIPQEVITRRPNNVIHGAFARPGQTDWAALCSVAGVSTILVFWNGSEKNPAAIAPVEDRHYLQSVTEHDIGFSRGITAVNKDFIMRHYEGYGGPKPPLMDHQGIDDAFLEKASITLYFHHGTWLKLTGAD